MPASTAVTITPARRIQGRLRVPGDKSIAHRYALLAALADGPSKIVNFATGADCASTLACLETLGVKIRRGTDAITIMGRGLRSFRSPASPLDAGNSGTTMRMLAGILAPQAFTSRLVGDASLSRRPMGRVIQPLALMGARIDAVEGHAPLVIHGAPLHGIAYEPDLPSAQVKSAVLLAGLHAEGATTVSERIQTRDHTERALETFGFDLKLQGRLITVTGSQPATGQMLTVPGDFSSAAFWMAAAAALPGSHVEVEGVGLNPTRTALLDVLRRFGARVEVWQDRAAAGEPHGTVLVEGDRQGAIDIAPEEVPALIDELPAVAALAAHRGQVSVRGARELRFKESDRITTLVAGFRGLGIAAEERDDGFVIRGEGAPAGGIADAHGDHRMAMAFAIAALAAERPSRIDGSDSVAISYPDFFETLERLVA
jgi:3-phosphoshikimate 1-carboxyvinyltransferase